MKIILFMAASLNGMISTKSGNEDFLSYVNWESFNKEAKKHDCFVIGRKTYEAVQKWSDYNFNNIDARWKIVVSHDTKLELDPSFSLANSPKEAVEKAIAMGFESMILVGGSTVNSAFMIENLIDEVMINFEPAIIGSGIRIFADIALEKRLSFIDCVQISDGILQVRYEVIRNQE